MHRHLLSLALFLLLPRLASADEIWTGSVDVKFRGYSTLHNFDGTVTQVPLKVTVAPGPSGRIVSATSSVEVKEMNTANEQRDKNMMTMFQQATYRFIKVEVIGAEERVLHPPGGGPGAMRVLLTIAGNKGTVNAVVTNVVAESPTQGFFDLAFPVSLKAFGLEPPATLGGLIKVKDTVNVTARVVLKRGAAK